ncbi:hypothetical protein Ocin01_04464 [Orchesella cincta]|uniref:Uncharacterized protein n=1 Tax=Orchesella cincta TaxID=48709 RepID=A0A1D2NAY0_ORCCI|nr:hypothetical protein Ocin01_04464 [Orchesella cincta]
MDSNDANLSDSVDFSAGKSALLQALALMNDNGEVASKISNVLDSVQEDRSRTVQLFCEVLALQKDEVERKKKCVDLLEEVGKWWKLLVDDREKLLVTISNLEMEKERILKRQSHPQEIYGKLVDAASKTQLLNRSMNSQLNFSRMNVVDANAEDDFVEATTTTINSKNK